MCTCRHVWRFQTFSTVAAKPETPWQKQPFNGIYPTMTFHLFSAHHLVNGGSGKMILIHTILTDVIQIPPLQNRSFNKHGSYLRQNTSLWAESPLGTCPTQTRQSRGRLRAGRSSETLWPSGSWKTGDKYKTINLIVWFSPLLKTATTPIPPIQRSSSQVWWWQTGEVSRLQYNAVKEGGKGSRIIQSCWQRSGSLQRERRRPSGHGAISRALSHPWL